MYHMRTESEQRVDSQLTNEAVITKFVEKI